MRMPRGDKSSYTDKQKRQAEHIEEGYKEEGISDDEAESRAWATVNKQTGGGKKSGSGRGRSKAATKKAASKSAKKAAKTRAAKKAGKSPGRKKTAAKKKTARKS